MPLKHQDHGWSICKDHTMVPLHGPRERYASGIQPYAVDGMSLHWTVILDVSIDGSGGIPTKPDKSTHATNLHDHYLDPALQTQHPVVVRRVHILIQTGSKHSIFTDLLDMPWQHGKNGLWPSCSKGSLGMSCSGCPRQGVPARHISILIVDWEYAESSGEHAANKRRGQYGCPPGRSPTWT